MTRPNNSFKPNTHRGGNLPRPKSVISIAATLRVGLIQGLGLMTKRRRKLCLGVAIYAASFGCAASLPRVNLCYDVLCFSMVEGESDLVKDRTYYHRRDGARLLIVRLKNASQARLLVRPVSESECPQNFEDIYARRVSQSGQKISSRGCLAIPAASRYFKVDFTLTSQTFPIDWKLRVLDPQVLIKDITDIKYWSGPTFSSSTLVLSPSGA